MRITSLEILEGDDGLANSVKVSLGDVVLLTGKNGSGKTRLIKRLVNYLIHLQNGTDDKSLNVWANISGNEVKLSVDNAMEIDIVNYSHYDARLQSAKDFSPYVISHSRQELKRCDYSMTALNALLFLDDMSHGYSSKNQSDRDNEWSRFVEEYVSQFDIKLTKNDQTGEALLFDFETEEAALSPGQLYLLRMAVACYCNENNSKVIFVLDEPELHLHPEAQIKLIEMIREKFPEAQLWVATHSITLMSYLISCTHNSTLLYLSNGEIRLPRSNLSELLNGVVGSEENIISIRQLLSEPEEYACNRFALECMCDPDVSDPLPNNPQNDLIKDYFSNGTVIVDYGAGKCRLIEELGTVIGCEQLGKVNYYAYDNSDSNALRAKTVLAAHNVSEDNYFNDEVELKKQIQNSADCVLMVNVLHEINPTDWMHVFANVESLLKDSGHLIIVEREELTIGESPYDEGFLMITKNGARELFGENGFVQHKHKDKRYIVAYVVNKDALQIQENNIPDCVNAIMNDAKKSIEDIKRANAEKKKLKQEDDKQRLKAGLRLAFHLNQFANSTILSEKLSLITQK